jgi:small subunit ribosomal protein S21
MSAARSRFAWNRLFRPYFRLHKQGDAFTVRASTIDHAGRPPPHLRIDRDEVVHLTSGNKLQVLVRDNNIEQALRVLKKKMQREGVFREMKARSAYEKPSEKRVREKAEAIRRTRKAARKQAQREGLLPAPKKKVLVPGARAPRPAA